MADPTGATMLDPTVCNVGSTVFVNRLLDPMCSFGRNVSGSSALDPTRTVTAVIQTATF